VAVFDITQRDSFNGLETAIKEFRLNCPPEAAENVVLVGNKADKLE
jgi:GTPase SAR1 family protein